MDEGVVGIFLIRFLKSDLTLWKRIYAHSGVSLHPIPMESTVGIRSIPPSPGKWIFLNDYVEEPIASAKAMILLALATTG